MPNKCCVLQMSANVTGLESGVYDVGYSPSGKSAVVVAGNNVLLAQWRKRSNSQELLHIP